MGLSVLLLDRLEKMFTCPLTVRWLVVHTHDKCQISKHSRTCQTFVPVYVSIWREKKQSQTEKINGTVRLKQAAIWSYSMSHLLLSALKEKVSPVEHDISFGIVKQQHKGWEDVNLWVHVVYTGSARDITPCIFTKGRQPLLLVCCTCCTCFALAGYRMMLSCDLLLVQAAPQIVSFQALMVEVHDSSKSHSTVHQQLFFFIISINACGNIS